MKRIAIVDNDSGVRLAASFFLKTHGFTVEGFDGGPHFLHADPSDFDCILLDLEMPGMNGFAVLRALAALENVPPIVVLTGSADRAMGESVIELGALEILEKPCPPEELLEGVKRAFDANSAKTVEGSQRSNPPDQS